MSSESVEVELVLRITRDEADRLLELWERNGFTRMELVRSEIVDIRERERHNDE